MKTIVIVMSVFVVLILIPVIYYAPWIYFSYQVKSNYINTYAIQNVGTKKDIRVLNVGVSDGTKIITYNHNKWECLTWQFIQLPDSSYLLKNLATQKTFEPGSELIDGVELVQSTLGGSKWQFWEFIEQANGEFLIRLKNTELYLTTTSMENNSSIVLKKLTKQENQRWNLIKQNPMFN